MTLKIKLWRLTVSPEEFTRRVATHVERMAEYNLHLEGVRIDAANLDMKPEDRRIAFPAPSADALIEQAAAEGYEFEGPSLAEKKAALFAAVTRMEEVALQSVIPPAKARHLQYREHDIRAKQAANFAATATYTVTIGDEDSVFLQEMDAKRAKQAAIQRAAAKLEHDIDDLTEATVDAFVLEPFGG